jgi:hypothetical protein
LGGERTLQAENFFTAAARVFGKSHLAVRCTVLRFSYARRRNTFARTEVGKEFIFESPFTA